MASLCDFVADDGSVSNLQVLQAQQAANNGELSNADVLVLTQAANNNETVDQCSIPDCETIAQFFDSVRDFANSDGTFPDDAATDMAFATDEYPFTFEDVQAIDAEIQNGCTLTDVLSLDVSANGGRGVASADATINVPGESSVNVTVGFTLDGGNRKVANAFNVTNGETVSVSYSGVSGGDHTVCAEIDAAGFP